MTRLVALYPRDWRDRYEEEFLGVMEARMPSIGDRLDILRGAIDARLHPQLGATRSGGPAPSRSARLGGVLAVVGGSLWAVAGIALNGTLVNPSLGYKEADTAGAIAVAAAAVTGLAGLAVTRSLPGRHALLWIMAIMAALGAPAMALPWPIVLLGFFASIVGTLLFGLLASQQLGVPGLILGGAALLVLVGFNTEDERALFLIPLGMAWIFVGLVLAVRGRLTNVLV